MLTMKNPRILKHRKLYDRNNRQRKISALFPCGTSTLHKSTSKTLVHSRYRPLSPFRINGFCFRCCCCFLFFFLLVVFCEDEFVADELVFAVPLLIEPNADAEVDSSDKKSVDGEERIVRKQLRK